MDDEKNFYLLPENWFELLPEDEREKLYKEFEIKPANEEELNNLINIIKKIKL